MSEKVSWKMLFLIGVSAGVIAVAFPRLLPYMSQTSGEVSLELFTKEFFYALVAFSVMIGVAMIWLYKETEEHTKNLFMTALALPAVLSGGINMTSVSSVAENGLAELNRQNDTLVKKLEGNSGVEFFELDLSNSNPVDVSSGPELDWLGISTAHAEGVVPVRNSGGGLQFSAPALSRDYSLVYAVTSTKAEIVQVAKDLESKNISNLTIIESNNRYYLLDTNKTTRADAVLNAIDVKEQYGFSPNVVRLK
jgi:hypothetical protein